MWLGLFPKLFLSLTWFASLSLGRRGAIGSPVISDNVVLFRFIELGWICELCDVLIAGEILDVTSAGATAGACTDVVDGASPDGCSEDVARERSEGVDISVTPPASSRILWTPARILANEVDDV